jgi:hypothetical protein
VAEDVRQGYVSAEEAEKLYGVVVDAKSYKVDAAATAKRRAALAKAAVPAE